MGRLGLGGCSMKEEMNNKYKITIQHPLIRPGIKIETEASEKYVVRVTNMLLDLARVIND
jgi:hypothetical protein